MENLKPFTRSQTDDRDSDHMSVFSINKSKNIKAYVGFEYDELKSTETSDLIQLKSTVITYLKSTTQKFKNGEFYGLYKRILEELKIRNVICDKTSGILNDSFDDNKNFLLGRKRSHTESIFDLEIPSFFNDKCSKKEKEEEDKSVIVIVEKENYYENENLSQTSESSNCAQIDKDNKCAKGI